MNITSLLFQSAGNTDKRIMDIYLEFGFESQRTFNQAFQQKYGRTPSKYRKYGGIIEYYESCREYIGKYYLRFERIWSGYAI